MRIHGGSFDSNQIDYYTFCISGTNLYTIQQNNLMSLHLTEIKGRIKNNYG